MALFSFGENLLQRLRMRRILSSIPKGAAVLDVGCGDGKLLQFLSPRIARGAGVDYRVAQQALAENIDLKPWRAPEPLPFPSASFTVVTMTAVLEHLAEPAVVLNECSRVLQPNGLILMTTPLPRAKPVLEFLAFRLGLLSAEHIAEHKHYYSTNETEQLLRSCGFNHVLCRPFQFGFNLFAKATKA